MKIVASQKMEELQRIEELLYGFNYAVWLEVFGPADSTLSLSDALNSLISKGAEIGGTSSATSAEVKDEVLDNLFYPGDQASGPEALEEKRAEIELLVSKVMEHIGLSKATQITRFWLSKGHPAYPVFWDFAFDVHASGQRWIIMGSSSD